MSSSAAKIATIKYFCTSIVIVAMIMVGGTSALAFGAGAKSRLTSEIAFEDCQVALPDAGVAPPCVEGEQTPVNMAFCPMLSFCGSMGSAAGHCAPNVPAGLAEFHLSGAVAVAITYPRTRIRAEGLPAEPLIQPPII